MATSEEFGSLTGPLPSPVMPTPPAPTVLARDEGEWLDALGEHQTVKLTTAETGGAFALIEAENPPGTGPPMRVHRREDVALYVVEGEAVFTVEDESFLARAGATLFLPRGTAHAYRVVGEAPARVLVLLAPAGLEDYFRRLSALEVRPNRVSLASLSAPYGVELVPAEPSG